VLDGGVFCLSTLRDDHYNSSMGVGLSLLMSIEDGAVCLA
jgi:hypothetical protein